jgi:deoxyguanosine kinase
MYVALEGPIAAGKTTLATLLAREVKAKLILERFNENAFLADFYNDKSRWALPMQLAFLIDRHTQFTELSDKGSIVADHTLAKDRVFAKVLLEGRELALYEDIASKLAPLNFSPDLIVYLDADNEELLRRIAERGRPYETGISGPYLDKLRRAYRQQFQNSDIPVLEVDTTNIDFNSRSQLEQLWREIVARVNSVNSAIP